MRKDEGGYIVVETIGSFLLLVLLMLSILSLVNIVAVQARIHYALTQAAETVSMYSYVLDVTGGAKYVTNNAGHAEHVQAEAGKFKSNVNGVLDGLKALSVNKVKDNATAAAGQLKDAASDPKHTISLLLNYGLSEAKNAAFADLMRPLVGHYLCNGGLSGDEYLKASKVIGGLEGLQFSPGLFSDGQGSVFLDSKGLIWLCVNYDVDYSFGALPLPFEPKLHVTQMVATKAWLGGNGEGYKK